MLRSAPAMLLALLAPSGAALADNGADAAFVSACVGVNLPGGTAAAEQRCVGIIAMSCANGAAPRDTAAEAVCLRREAKAWVVVMDDAWASLSARAEANAARADGAAALRRAQTAWEAFADAECTYAHAIWGESAYREVAGADCRLNTIARRAIQLRAQIGPTG